MPIVNEFPSPIQLPLNGVTLEIFEAGEPGRPIVLCHGFPEHAYAWRHQIPALVEAGYHVLVPNQRGYGNSSRPDRVDAYGITELTGDLAALLDHYGYDNATFVGHDWGANVVWRLAQLHPDRVSQLINLALPYQPRGDRPWLELMAAFLGEDYYFVHFDRQPGVADAVLNAHPRRFLRNLFRKNVPPAPPAPGSLMMNLATAKDAPGDPILTEHELEVFVSAFEATGFTGAINWYRNLDRNWHTLAAAPAVIEHRALMIYGERDSIPPSEHLQTFVPNVDVVSLDCGHWIQQERPADTNRVMLEWLAR